MAVSQYHHASKIDGHCSKIVGRFFFGNSLRFPRFQVNPNAELYASVPWPDFWRIFLWRMDTTVEAVFCGITHTTPSWHGIPWWTLRLEWILYSAPLVVTETHWWKSRKRAASMRSLKLGLQWFCGDFFEFSMSWWVDLGALEFLCKTQAPNMGKQIVALQATMERPNPFEQVWSSMLNYMPWN